MSNSTARMPPILSRETRTVKFMTILVTGATGNIGRLVVNHLIDLGANDIRALTKNPEKADLPDGVTPVTGYLGDPDSAARGTRRRRTDVPGAAAADARGHPRPGQEAQVSSYVVALSGGAHWQEHADTVAASGLVNTQLGPGEFLENFASWSAPDQGRHERCASRIRTWSRRRSRWTTSPGWPPRCWSNPIGRTTDRMYELTGPQALTRAQIAEQIGVGIGADVTFEQCSRAEAEEALLPVMGDEATWYLDLLADSIDAPQQANRLVAELTGTPAESVAQWAARNADLFASSETGPSR